MKKMASERGREKERVCVVVVGVVVGDGGTREDGQVRFGGDEGLEHRGEG